MLTGFLSVHSLSSDENLRSNLDHFRTTRNDYVNPEEKTKARDYIVKTFNDFGLDTWTQEFPSNQAKVRMISTPQAAQCHREPNNIPRVFLWTSCGKARERRSVPQGAQ